LAEEEGAPELEKEDLAKTVKENAACLLVIGAKEGGLSHTEMSIYNTEESTNNLGDYNHTYQGSFLEKLTLCRINGECDCWIEHTSRNFACHKNTHEKVESDGESGGSEVVSQDEHSSS